MKHFTLLAWVPLACALPAFANVTIASPTSGAEVVSPFSLVAAASECSSQFVTSMSYWIDNNNPTIVRGSSINTSVSSITGAHTVYLKSIGRQGAVCEASVAIIVVPDPTSLVPSDALIFNGIQALSSWQYMSLVSSGGTTASGSTKTVARPSLSGQAREFATQFTNYDDELYYTVIGDNTAVTNFLYDGWVYVARPSKGIANVELDMNQVMSNGQTVIFGFQCDGYSGTWDYTANEGTPEAYSDQWLHSLIPCNPRNWTTNTWHHVQITYSRDENGGVTYQSVWFDGVEGDINATVSSAFALGWAPVLLTNFEVDGYGASGSSTLYLDKLTVYGW